jgi:hypothetical protein
MERNRSEFGNVLDGEVSCPERLERRLRRRSDAASSSKVSMSVGTAGPGFRNWMLWISQLRIDERRFCDIISESPCVSELATSVLDERAGL